MQNLPLSSISIIYYPYSHNNSIDPFFMNIPIIDKILLSLYQFLKIYIYIISAHFRKFNNFIFYHWMNFAILILFFIKLSLLQNEKYLLNLPMLKLMFQNIVYFIYRIFILPVIFY